MQEGWFLSVGLWVGHDFYTTAILPLSATTRFRQCSTTAAAADAAAAQEAAAVNKNKSLRPHQHTALQGSRATRAQPSSHSTAPPAAPAPAVPSAATAAAGAPQPKAAAVVSAANFIGGFSCSRSGMHRGKHRNAGYMLMLAWS